MVGKKQVRWGGVGWGGVGWGGVGRGADAASSPWGQAILGHGRGRKEVQGNPLQPVPFREHLGEWMPGKWAASPGPPFPRCPHPMYFA